MLMENKTKQKLPINKNMLQSKGMYPKHVDQVYIVVGHWGCTQVISKQRKWCGTELSRISSMLYLDKPSSYVRIKPPDTAHTSDGTGREEK